MNRILKRFRQRLAPQSFPETVEDLAKSDLFTGWYYSVELMPGLITRGQYRDSFPLLPRILLRNCDLRGTTCLDLGSMEGLMAVLMCRQGAKAVLATDAIDHCGEKMAALRYYYKANFEFQQIGAGKRFTQWSNVVKSDIPQDWQMPRIYSYYSRPFARY